MTAALIPLPPHIRSLAASPASLEHFAGGYCLRCDGTGCHAEGCGRHLCEACCRSLYSDGCVLLDGEPYHFGCAVYNHAWLATDRDVTPAAITNSYRAVLATGAEPSPRDLRELAGWLLEPVWDACGAMPRAGECGGGGAK